MALHHELTFEQEICEVLGSHGWLYDDKTTDNYDRKLALYPPDLTAWLQDSQNDVWETYKQKTRCQGRATAAGAHR